MKHKKTLIFLTLIFSSTTIFAQTSASRLTKLPQNNPMVNQCLMAIRWINNGDIDSLRRISNNNNDIDSITRYHPKLIQSGQRDTSMIEIYDSPAMTEISYCVKDNDPNRQIQYCIIFKSDGINGSTHNFQIQFKLDNMTLKLIKEIENLPEPK